MHVSGMKNGEWDKIKSAKDEITKEQQRTEERGLENQQERELQRQIAAVRGQPHASRSQPSLFPSCPHANTSNYANTSYQSCPCANACTAYTAPGPVGGMPMPKPYVPSPPPMFGGGGGITMPVPHSSESMGIAMPIPYPYNSSLNPGGAPMMPVPVPYGSPDAPTMPVPYGYGSSIPANWDRGDPSMPVSYFSPNFPPSSSGNGVTMPVPHDSSSQRDSIPMPGPVINSTMFPPGFVSITITTYSPNLGMRSVELSRPLPAAPPIQHVSPSHNFRSARAQGKFSTSMKSIPYP